MSDYTYVSFASPGACLGVCILEGALGPEEAAQKAHDLGIDPGGQVLALPFSEGDPDIPPGQYEAMTANLNRLIPPEEARDLFEAKTIREHEAN